MNARKPIVFLGILLYLVAIAAPARAAGPKRISRCTTIDESGSYVLTKNIVEPDRTTACISIEADFVTLDLGGHAIIGGEGVSPSAIVTPQARVGITVRNGLIRDFGAGVNLGGRAHRVEGVRVAGHATTAVGVQVGSGSIVTNCVIDTSRNECIYAGAGSIVRHNVAGKCKIGIDAGPGSLVADNMTYLNTLRGIEVEAHSLALRNVSHNIGAGIQLECPSSAIENTVSGSEAAISVSSLECYQAGNFVN